MNFQIIEHRPPKIAQLVVLVAAVIHWSTPLNQVQLYSNRILGIIVGIGGFSLMMWGWWLFRKHGAAICPTAKTDRLVTSGIYRVTRNPMYLGVIVMLIAIAFFVGSMPFYLAATGYFLIINNAFCPYEENKLTEAFGDTYLIYKQEVRRWL